MHHAVQFFLNREAFKAFQRWQEYVINKQEHEEMVAKAVSAFPTAGTIAFFPWARASSAKTSARPAWPLPA